MTVFRSGFFYTFIRLLLFCDRVDFLQNIPCIDCLKLSFSIVSTEVTVILSAAGEAG